METLRFASFLVLPKGGLFYSNQLSSYSFYQYPTDSDRARKTYFDPYNSSPPGG